MKACEICGAPIPGGRKCQRHELASTSFAVFPPVPAKRPGLTLVAGPPCGGKSMYARGHAQPGDLVLDSDSLYEAFGGDRYANSEEHRPFVWAAFFAVVAEQRKQLDAGFRLWVVQCAPGRETRDRYREMNGAEVVVLETPIEVCLDRAKDRPPAWGGFIRDWWSAYETDENDTRLKDPFFQFA